MSVKVWLILIVTLEWRGLEAMKTNTYKKDSPLFILSMKRKYIYFSILFFSVLCSSFRWHILFFRSTFTSFSKHNQKRFSHSSRSYVFHCKFDRERQDLGCFIPRTPWQAASILHIQNFCFFIFYYFINFSWLV